MTGPKPSGPTHPTPTGPPKADPQTPARQSNRPQDGSPQAGGPVPNVPAGGRARDGRAVGAGGAATFALPEPPRLRFVEGAHRLVGARLSDPPDPGPIPNPHPYPPPVRPGLSWLPALALPSLLLLAAIDHAAWLASL